MKAFDSGYIYISIKFSDPFSVFVLHVEPVGSSRLMKNMACIGKLKNGTKRHDKARYLHLPDKKALQGVSVSLSCSILYTTSVQIRKKNCYDVHKNTHLSELLHQVKFLYFQQSVKRIF